MEPAERLDRLKAVLVDGALGVALMALSRLPFIGWPFTLGLIALTGIQLYLLATKGQTVGKQLLKIRIVRADTLENGGFMTNVVWRTFVNFLLAIVPLYILVDVAFIFREDRRCVHDWLAKTVVVKK